MRSVKENFAWNSAYQIVRIAIPLVTTPYLARVLGSEPLGVYAYTYTIAMYFTYFVLLGLNQYGNREIAKTRNDRRSLSKTFWSIYLGQLGVGAMVSIAYFAFAFGQSGEIEVCALIWSVWVLAEVADISWLFYGLEEFKLITVRNVFIRIGVVAGIFVFVRSPADLWLYCALQASSFALNAVVLWPLVRKRLDYCKVARHDVLRHIRPSLTLFAPVVAISCYTQLNKVLLGGFAGMSQVAFYDNADKIVIVPLALIQSLGTVLLPRMSSVLASGDFGRAKEYLSNSLWLSMVMASGLFFGIAGASHEFVPVFFGEGFEECETLLPLLALIIPACAASSALGNQFLIPYERDALYLKSVFAGAVVNVALCVALVPFLAAVGAAVATVVAEFVVVAVQIRYVKNDLPVFSYFKEIVPFYLFGVVEFAAMKSLALTGLSGVGLLAAEVAIGVLVFAVFAFGYLIVRGDERLRLFGLERFIKSEG